MIGRRKEEGLGGTCDGPYHLIMKTNSLLVLLLFFFCTEGFAAVGASALAEDGIYATFGSRVHKKSELLDQKFTFMTKDLAEKFGISKGEMESYNRDLDQLNALMNEISHDLGEMKRPTIDDAVGLWSGLKGAVSVSTLTALKKITRNIERESGQKSFDR